MKFRSLHVLSLFAALALVTGGGGPAETKSSQTKEKGAKKDKPGQVAEPKKDDKKDHDHAGWWCDEHGVPEEVCGQCNAKLAAEFKKKGDWCQDHDRPKSQCFQCDPKLKEKFAAQYRAKYGKEPPPTEDDEKKDDKKAEKKG
jgi:cobalt-zinc-cadmium efflux system membrane fusion protein